MREEDIVVTDEEEKKYLNDLISDDENEAAYAKRGEEQSIEHYLMNIPPDFDKAEIHGVSFSF